MNIKFVKGNKSNTNYTLGIILLDELVYKRSENSLRSMLSRIRNEFNITNDKIHYIGINGIHYEVVLRINNEYYTRILRVKSSKDELNLRIMMTLARNTSLNELNDIIEKVAFSHSLIKKKKRIFKKYHYYYRILMGEVDQSTLDKFCYLYNIDKKLDIGDYSRLLTKVCHMLEEYSDENDDFR